MWRNQGPTEECVCESSTVFSTNRARSSSGTRQNGLGVRGRSWKKALLEVQQQNKATNNIEATMYLLMQMQSEAWPEGLDTIKQLEPRKRSELLSKSPFIDDSDGLPKVGGRLARADLSFGRKHPILIPTLPSTPNYTRLSIAKTGPPQTSKACI